MMCDLYNAVASQSGNENEKKSGPKKHQTNFECFESGHSGLECGNGFGEVTLTFVLQLFRLGRLLIGDRFVGLDNLGSLLDHDSFFLNHLFSNSGKSISVFRINTETYFRFQLLPF